MIVSRTDPDTLSEGSYNIVYGWWGSHNLGSVGFSTREANLDFMIIKSLDLIEKSPQKHLHYLNIASSLIELNKNDLASYFIDKSLSIKPDCLDAKYAQAIIEIEKNNTRLGVDILEEVIQLNPRHHKASLILAKIYKANDINDKSQQHLATYEKFYKCSAAAASQYVAFNSNLIFPKPKVPVELSPIETKVEPAVNVVTPPDQTIPLVSNAEIETIVNGPKYLVVKGSAMIPIRQICNWLGAKTEYNKDSSIVNITFNESIISMALNSMNASVNGRLQPLSSPPIEKNNTIYIPLRFLIDNLSIKSEIGKAGVIKLKHPSKNSIFLLTK